LWHPTERKQPKIAQKGFSSFKKLRYQRVGQLQLPFTDIANQGTEKEAASKRRTPKVFARHGGQAEQGI
jgi:hypothetical protein